MTDKVSCEIFLAINENGDYEVGVTAEEATERLDENAGGAVVRVIKIAAKAAQPEITEAEVDLPDEAGTTAAVELAAE